MRRGVRGITGSIVLCLLAGGMATGATAGQPRGAAPLSANDYLSAGLESDEATVGGFSAGATVEARCDPGEELLGGGAFWYEGSQRMNAAETGENVASIPTKTEGIEAWRAVGQNVSGIQQKLRVYAYCNERNSAPKPEWVSDADTIRKGETQNLKAACPRNHVVISGGTSWVSPDGVGSGKTISSTPSKDLGAWLVRGRNNSSFNRNKLTVRALCVKDDRVRPIDLRHDEVGLGDGASSFGTASCGPNFYTIAGGVTWDDRLQLPDGAPGEIFWMTALDENADAVDEAWEATATGRGKFVTTAMCLRP
jgi:hypothetical protein